MSIVDNIVAELGDFLRAAAEFVGSRATEIPSRSLEKWKIARELFGRILENEVTVYPDYLFFLGDRRSEVGNWPSFGQLFGRIRADSSLAHAFRLEVDQPDAADDLLNRYLLPLATYLLRRVDSGGEWEHELQTGLKLLDDFLQEDTYPATFSAPLVNFHSNLVDVEIVDGIYLRAVSDATLESYINSMVTFRGFPEGHRLLALEFQLETTMRQPRTRSQPMAIGSQVQVTSQQLLKAFRLIKPGAIGFAFIHGDATGPLGFGSSWMGLPGYEEVYGGTYQFSADDVPEIRKVLSNLRSLEGDTRFSLAMRRFMGSYQKPLDGDRLIDYWIALESLLMPEDDVSELKYRVGLRAACFLAEPENRTQVFDEIQKSYKIRSKFVHGVPVKVDPLLVTYTEHCLRQVLLRCLELKHAPTREMLDSMVLGAARH